MMNHERFYGAHPEYPEYHHHHDEMIQADWNEKNPRDPSFIHRKPNVILDINGFKPDENGTLDISANDFFKIDGIPNQDLYVVCEEIFEAVM